MDSERLLALRDAMHALLENAPKLAGTPALEDLIDVLDTLEYAELVLLREIKLQAKEAVHGSK
jgi:hypothetical protein